MTRTQHSFVAPSGLALAVHDWGGAGDPVLLSTSSWIFSIASSGVPMTANPVARLFSMISPAVSPCTGPAGRTWVK